MSDYEEMAPGTGLINSIRAEKSPYYLWAGEAIDNSLDAGASQVQLTMAADRLDCKDDGVGVTKLRAEHIVRISSHGEMSGTKLGRYGVGIKYKSIQHGKKLRIQSVSKDGRLRRTADWEEMLQSGRWQYPLAIYSDVAPGTPTGTLVSILGLRSKSPSKADIDRTRAEIARRYYPALETGKMISVNGELVEPIAQPELKDVVEVVLEFPGGRSARIRGGMLINPSGAKLRQVDVCVAFRVIKPESAFGCNGYGGIRSMYARIDLIGDAWLLTKFKDDIAEDPYQDDLETAVEDILRPILERCSSESMSLKEQTLENLLNEMLPEDHRMTRPQQKQSLGRQGPKSGDKRTREVVESDASPTGPTQKKKPPRGIMIEFEHDLNDICGWGRAQFGKSSTRIQLAKDNRDIALLMSCRDQQIAKISLFGIASLLYVGDLHTQNPHLLDEPIGLRAWRLARQSEPSISEAAE